MSLPDAGSDPTVEVTAPAEATVDPVVAELADEAAAEPEPTVQDVVESEVAVAVAAEPEAAVEAAVESGEPEHLRLRRELNGQLEALSGPNPPPLAEQAAAFERLHQDLVSGLARIEGV